MIKATGVTKAYGQDYVLTDVSFEAHGDTAVLGRKKSGKTALADIITGCVYPESGGVCIFGHDMANDPKEAKRAIGYMPQQSPLYPDMTPVDYLSFVCSLHGIRGAMRRLAISDALEKAGVKVSGGREIKELSRCEQKRLSLAGALCGSPKALILDEPCEGLDPEQALCLRDTIKSLRGEYMLVLFTRSIHEAAELCDSVAVIRGSRIAANENINELLGAAQRKRRITVRLKADRQTGLALLKSVSGIEYIEHVGSRESGTYDYIVEAEQDPRESIFRAAAKEGTALIGMGCVTVTPDDICAELTGGGPE